MPVASRTSAVNIRLTAAERERIYAAALIADLKLSDFIRSAALEAAKQIAKRPVEGRAHVR